MGKSSLAGSKIFSLKWLTLARELLRTYLFFWCKFCHQKLITYHLLVTTYNILTHTKFATIITKIIFWFLFIMTLVIASITLERRIYRSSPLDVIVRKGVRKYAVNLQENSHTDCDFHKVAKQLYWNRTSAWVNRTPFPENTSGRLLLYDEASQNIWYGAFLEI